MGLQFFKKFIYKFLSFAKMQVLSVKAYKKEHEILTLSQTNIGSLKLKTFADNNFRFDENVSMFSKRLKLNTSGKAKLLTTSNLSFSFSIFKRLLLQTCKNTDVFGKWLTNA